MEDGSIKIVIDDLLPTRKGSLIYTKYALPVEFWPALLEKTYAKVKLSNFATQIKSHKFNLI